VDRTLAERTKYFDNAATTFPKPEVVYKAMDEFYRNYGVNAGRSSYKLARKATDLIDETRELLAEMVSFNKTERIIFTPSATIAMNQIISGLEWDEDKTVYITPFEHNAIIRPLRYIEKKYNIKIKTMPFNSLTFELDIDRLKKDFEKDSPNYLFMSHVSNVTGFILPIDEIITCADKYNSVTVLDCAQSMGLIPISLQKLKVDYLVFAGHKTLYGPFGIAGYIDNSKIGLKEFIIGGTGSDSLNYFMPESYPSKYEAASQNICAIAGLNASLKWIKEIGIDNIRDKELKLTKQLVGGLEDIYGVAMYMPKDIIKHVGIVSCNLDDYKPEDLGMILDEDYGIAVRTGYHCAADIHSFLGTKHRGGTVRLSLGYFNEESDVDYLIENLKQL